MTDTLSYRYVEPALLERPYHYMYTPYEGHAFLDAWARERSRFRTALLARRAAGGPVGEEAALGDEIYAAVGGHPPPRTSAFGTRSPVVWPHAPGEVAFETRGLLLDLWQATLAGDAGQVSAYPLWVERLAKRFEIAKRLHPRYTAQIRPVDKPGPPPGSMLDAYALLASLLAFECRVRPDLGHLNTLLKLLDIVAATGSAALGPLGVPATLAAVEQEVAAVEALMGRHGVRR